MNKTAVRYYLVAPLAGGTSGGGIALKARCTPTDSGLLRGPSRGAFQVDLSGNNLREARAE
jgi:hypothetical protein